METIQINDSFDQKTVRISVGDIIEIQLDETPTTGYKWEISEINTGEIELLDQAYKLYEGTGIGGGGQKTVKLKVSTEGNGKIVLENRQRWSSDVYKTFTLYYSSQKGADEGN